jgi:hypothetical protein
MFDTNTTVIILICFLIFGIGIWYYFQNQESYAPIQTHKPLENVPAPVNMETANIERQIQQVLAFRDPPEIAKLKELEQEFEQDPTRWDILIAVGDIYRKGAFPRFLPNEELALKCYKISSSCPDGKIAGIGQSKYVEARDDPILNGDRAGEPLPTDIGLRICATAESAVQTTPWHLFEKPTMMQEQMRQQDTVYDFMGTGELGGFGGDDDFWATVATATTRTAGTTFDNTIPEYRFDAQNVHDHGVTKVTQFNINKLKDNIDINSLNNSNKIENIKNKILSSITLDSTTKEDALHVIDKLSDATNGSFNVTEKQTLAMVLDKIDQQPGELRENLTETLAKQLASSIENGHIVCSSGKISRIMGTLDGVSNESVRPMWAVREELGGLAVKIRDDVTREFGDTPEAGRRIQEKFEKEVKEQYIGKLGMSEKVINPMIEEYKLGF